MFRFLEAVATVGLFALYLMDRKDEKRDRLDEARDTLVESALASQERMMAEAIYWQKRTDEAQATYLVDLGNGTAVQVDPETLQDLLVGKEMESVADAGESIAMGPEGSTGGQEPG